MIVLDTNVVSELMRPTPAPSVEEWVASRDGASLFLTAVAEAELRYGVLVMPAGHRRDVVSAALDAMLLEDFGGRVLPFDSAAANAYAAIAAARRAIGRPVCQSDAQIAAIARSRSMSVATRNIRDFEEMEVDLMNPWTASEV
ncbi:MAG: type II toxin-antitoxin system VapC family toxin [Acidimicrobiaceae bacterium]|nr:type II toxin-antitoxin system VapC family toxin [Acidimicrobiaceae bacterium]